jgi:hypothetical protein
MTGTDTVELVVSGHIPDWLDTAAAAAVHSPQQPRRPEHNVWNALLAACRLLGPGVDFVYMHDDYFATAKPDFSARVHAGAAAAHIDRMRGRLDMTPFRSRLARTVAFLRARGRVEPASWETHTPLPLNTDDVTAAAAALAAVNLPGSTVAQRTLIAELAGHTGEAITDVKVRDVLDGPLPTPWVSTGTAAWAGQLGDALRARFTTPSPWEHAAP